MKLPILKMDLYILSALIMAHFTTTGLVKAQEVPSKLLHIEKTATVRLAGAPEAVFALLEPRGRQRRMTNWNMEFLYPRSGDALSGAVIRQVHRSGAVEQIWLLAEHEPPSRIKYVIFVPGMEVWEFDIHLRSTPQNETIAAVDHRITALAQDVNTEVRNFDNNFEAYVERWRSGINAALKEDGSQ